jgi:putative hydrolase of the HAD superfamily
MAIMIKNIVFDFGDIFIDLDKTASLKAMWDFGLKSLSPKLIALNEAYEKGEIETGVFIDSYLKELPKLNRDQVKDAWNAIILYFPEYRLEWIEQLSSTKKYRLFLLSNTNELHIDQVIRHMGLSRYERFKKCFEKFYLSHESKMRKPDAAIYQMVLDSNGLLANETLFIDDTKENTESAALLGMATWNLIPKKEDIVNLFNRQIFQS